MNAFPAKRILVPMDAPTPALIRQLEEFRRRRESELRRAADGFSRVSARTSRGWPPASLIAGKIY